MEMPEIKLTKRTTTGKAVHLLREYARYLDEHADALIGDIEPPNYITDGGIKVSFTLCLREFPHVSIEKEYLVLNQPMDASNKAK